MSGRFDAAEGPPPDVNHMSEEKPTFKVTDRRLFNPDGSARDIEREEEPPAPPAPEASAAAPAPSGDVEQHDDSADIVDASYVARDATPTGGGITGAPAHEHGGAGAAPAEADDAQDFLMVVEFVASFAADALGMVEHPGAGRGEVNLPLAKQCIDMLGTLRRKTQGNLSAEEEHVFDLILSQLRMQYVQLSNAPRGPQPPRGFTGSDITGGR